MSTWHGAHCGRPKTARRQPCIPSKYYERAASETTYIFAFRSQTNTKNEWRAMLIHTKHGSNWARGRWVIARRRVRQTLKDFVQGGATCRYKAQHLLLRTLAAVHRRVSFPRTSLQPQAATAAFAAFAAFAAVAGAAGTAEMLQTFVALATGDPLRNSVSVS